MLVCSLRLSQYVPAKFCGQLHLIELIEKYRLVWHAPPLQVLTKPWQLRLELEVEQRPQVFLQYV